MSKADARSDSDLAPCAATRIGIRGSDVALWLTLIGAAGIPLSLLWDYSWECTVGLDRFWSPPHAANYLAVALAFFGALAGITRSGVGVRIGVFCAPIASWITLWGGIAFVTSVIFDRWWQSAYGLSAGIWHPPQICKAIAFVAILTGTWAQTAQNQESGDKPVSGQGELPFILAGASLLALVSVINLTPSYPNRQHSGWFFEISCAAYPLVLLGAAASRRARFGATKVSLIYMALWCGMLWLLPLFPARPLTAPVYNLMDRMMPPPFPLLLALPALAIDFVLGRAMFSASRKSDGFWLKAVVAGFAFATVFGLAQWFVSAFLLSDAAAGWFFAGGGRHWPFFFKVSELMRQVYWSSAGEELNESSALVAVAWATGSAWCGCWIGRWLGGLRR